MSIKNYIEKHNLESILSETINVCSKFRSEEPLIFMANYLKQKTNRRIIKLYARMILDFRGLPTLHVEMHTLKGVVTASCPSGSCIGIYEKRELRDEDPSRYLGMGIQRCVNFINDIIAPRLLDQDPANQQDLDELLNSVSEAPGNVIHPVSVAICKAGAIERDVPLYQHIRNNWFQPNENKSFTLPMFTLIEGGTFFFHEIYIVPVGARTFEEAVRMGVEVFQHLKRNSKEPFVTGPNGGKIVDSTFEIDDILNSVVKAIAKARHTGKIQLGLNINASELLTEDNHYDLNVKTNVQKPCKKSANEMIHIYETLVEKYHVHFIEDPFDADDYDSFKRLTEKHICKVIGTNVFASCPKRVEVGARDKWCDVMALKPNQAGTLTDALRSAQVASENGLEVVVSDRTGSTDDTFVADLSIALNAHYIKAGSPSRATIYNQMLRF